MPAIGPIPAPPVCRMMQEARLSQGDDVLKKADRRRMAAVARRRVANFTRRTALAGDAALAAPGVAYATGG